MIISPELININYILKKNLSFKENIDCISLLYYLGKIFLFTYFDAPQIFDSPQLCAAPQLAYKGLLF